MAKNKNKFSIISHLTEGVKRLFPLTYKCSPAIYKREYEAMLDLVAERRITSDNTGIIIKQLVDFIESIGYTVVEEQAINADKDSTEVTYLIMEGNEVSKKYGIAYWSDEARNWSQPVFYENYLDLLGRIEGDVSLRGCSSIPKANPLEGFRIYEYIRNKSEIGTKVLVQWKRMLGEPRDNEVIVDKITKIRKQWIGNNE